MTNFIDYQTFLQFLFCILKAGVCEYMSAFFSVFVYFFLVSFIRCCRADKSAMCSALFFRYNNLPPNKLKTSLIKNYGSTYSYPKKFVSSSSKISSTTDSESVMLVVLLVCGIPGVVIFRVGCGSVCRNVCVYRMDGRNER